MLLFGILVFCADGGRTYEVPTKLQPRRFCWLAAREEACCTACRPQGASHHTTSCLASNQQAMCTTITEWEQPAKAKHAMLVWADAVFTERRETQSWRSQGKQVGWLCPSQRPKLLPTLGTKVC